MKRKAQSAPDDSPPPAQPNLGNDHGADIEWDTTTVTPEASWYYAEKHKKQIRRWARAAIADIQSRDLSCIDCFGASAKIKACFEQHGEAAVNYDIKVNGEMNDITSSKGFYELLRLGLSLKPGGLIKGGPPCSLFIFLSSSVHKRTASSPEGNQQNWKVRMANLIINNFIVMMDELYAQDRRFYFITEQPVSSYMMKMATAESFLRRHKATTVLTYMGCFGHSLLKASHLFGTLPTLSILARTKPPQFRSSGDRSDYYHSTSSGVQGGKALPGAAEYTELYCEAVYHAWRRATCFQIVSRSGSDLSLG